MVHLNSTGTSDVKVNKTYYGIKCLGIFQFSILPGKLVSITVFTLFSHDYFFCVFEKQHKRGVAWHDTTLCRLQRWCVKIWASLPRLSHSKHNSKCLPPLNVSLWPLESLSRRKLYIFCFVTFFWWWTLFILPWIRSAGSFSNGKNTFFSSLQLLRKKFTKTAICKQYIITWHVKLYIFLGLIKFWESTCENQKP